MDTRSLWLGGWRESDESRGMVGSRETGIVHCSFSSRLQRWHKSQVVLWDLRAERTWNSSLVSSWRRPSVLEGNMTIAVLRWGLRQNHPLERPETKDGNHQSGKDLAEEDEKRLITHPHGPIAKDRESAMEDTVPCFTQSLFSIDSQEAWTKPHGKRKGTHKWQRWIFHLLNRRW